MLAGQSNDQPGPLVVMHHAQQHYHMAKMRVDAVFSKMNGIEDWREGRRGRQVWQTAMMEFHGPRLIAQTQGIIT